MRFIVSERILCKQYVMTSEVYCDISLFRIECHRPICIPVQPQWKAARIRIPIKCLGRFALGGWFGTWNVEFDITALFCSSVHTRSYLHVNVNCPFPASAPRSRRNFSRRVSHTSERGARWIRRRIQFCIALSLAKRNIILSLNILMYFFVCVHHTNIRLINRSKFTSIKPSKSIYNSQFWNIVV